MKILTVVGARPQFIKAAPVSKILRKSADEILAHSGQHYDRELSAIFFEQLDIPVPDYNLNIGSGTHASQTGQMLIGLEEILLAEEPDWVLIYGDTNSTLAGALAAVKLGIPLAHVEAGLRSFNWNMPEEVNRVLSDRCSTALFCPTQTAVDNLATEGIRDGVHIVGDVMVDAMLHILPRTDQSDILDHLQMTSGDYILATLHRPANVDKQESLRAALECLERSVLPVILPLHPRTRASLQRHKLTLPDNVNAVDPVGYVEMLALEKNAAAILTDSGGIQKEAYVLGIPCITMREETEWVETVESGWNQIVGLDPDKVAAALEKPTPSGERSPLFGDGQAASRIVGILTGPAAGPKS